MFTEFGSYWVKSNIGSNVNGIEKLEFRLQMEGKKTKVLYFIKICMIYFIKVLFQ